MKEATRLLDLPKLARERVKKGAEWLDQYGPKDWRSKMIHILSGSVISQVDFRYLVNYPLTLVFACDKSLRKSGCDHVDWPEVAKKFGQNKDKEEAERLGFWETEHRAPNYAFVPSELDCLFLNEAWASLLRNERLPKPLRQAQTSGGLGTSQGVGQMEMDRVASHSLLFP